MTLIDPILGAGASWPASGPPTRDGRAASVRGCPFTLLAAIHPRSGLAFRDTDPDTIDVDRDQLGLLAQRLWSVSARRTTRSWPSRSSPSWVPPSRLGSAAVDGGRVSSLPNGYRLNDGAPATADYLELRLRAGLSPKAEDQAVAALAGSWAACHVVHEAALDRRRWAG